MLIEELPENTRVIYGGKTNTQKEEEREHNEIDHAAVDPCSYCSLVLAICPLGAMYRDWSLSSIITGVRKDGTRDVQTIKAMILKAIQNPVGSQQPFREKLKTLVEKGGKSGSPKVVFAFDDTSIPLPPMSKPDIRSLIMETCEGKCNV